MKVSNDMMVVPARMLDPPMIQYGAGKINPRNASWNLVNQKFSKGATMAKWSYIVIEEPGQPIDVRIAITIVKSFCNVCRQYGMNVQDPTLTLHDGKPPQKVVLPNRRGRSHTDLEVALKPAFKQFMDHNSKAKDKITILYIFLPSPDRGVYASVKYCGDTKAGISTVCSRWTQVNKDRGQDQYLANVALKFNLKQGGKNHVLSQNQLGPLANGKTMIVCAQVC